MVFILLSILLLYCSEVRCQKRLYYTGKYKNEDTSSIFFAGATVSTSDFFHYSNHTSDWIPDFNSSFLFSGGTFVRLKYVNTSIDEDFLQEIRLEVLGSKNEVFELKNAAFFKQLSSFDYGLAMTDVNVDPNGYLLEAEIGLYDHSRDVFIEKYWREISGGDLIAVTATTHCEGHDDLSDLSAVSSIACNKEHRVVYTSDFMGRKSVFSHTWTGCEETGAGDLSKEDEAIAAAGDAESDKDTILLQESEIQSRPLRVMTYNLWHNNPPSWIYQQKMARWNRYEKRMKHFAEVVAAEDPDVIALQEVRHDSAFTNTSRRTDHWNDLQQSKEDAGSQVEHLLSHLASARRRLAEAGLQYNEQQELASGAQYYQYVFHPAMAMMDRTRLVYRNEEGLLVLSKLPIVSSDVQLLPRRIGDSSDDHQRIVLRVTVELRGDTAEGRAADPVHVDIMTTHLSLSESARDLSARQIVQLAACREGPPSPEREGASRVQVLTGDFNAEPEENFIQYLLHPDSFAASNCPSSADSATTEIQKENKYPPFVDSWQAFSSAQRAVSSQPLQFLTEVDVSGNVVANAHRDAAAEGLTFPACNPVKRIDFILVRNHTLLSDAPPQTYAVIHNSRVVGTRPTADTEHLVGSREGLGMNDKDSPVWASDHFAVVTDLLITSRGGNKANSAVN